VPGGAPAPCCARAQFFAVIAFYRSKSRRCGLPVHYTTRAAIKFNLNLIPGPGVAKLTWNNARVPARQDT